MGQGVGAGRGEPLPVSRIEVGQALDDYLGCLLQEGERVSSGVFELDPRVALQKLQNFSWESPQAYAIPLLACSYHLGASRIEFTLGASTVQVDLLGIRPLTRGHLQNLFCYAFSNQEPGLRHLALAVLCGLRFAGVAVKLQTERESATYSVLGEPKLEKLSRPLQAGLRFQIIRLGWASRLGLGSPLTPPDRKLVASRAAYAPVTVHWQGEPQAKPPLPSCRATETYVHEAWPLPSGWSPDQTFASPGDFSAWIGLGCEDAGLIWMVDGLSFREDSVALGFPWVQVRAVAPLRVDASYQFVVRDSVYADILELLRTRIESLAARHVRLAWDDRISLDILRAVMVRWATHGQEKLLLGLRRRLLRMADDAKAWGDEFHPAVEMACQELSRSQDPDEAREASLFLLRALGASKIQRENREIEELVFRVTGDPLEIRGWYQRLVLADRYCPTTLEGCAAILPRDVAEFEEKTEDVDLALANVLYGLSSGRFDPHALWVFASQSLLSVPDGFRHTRTVLTRLQDSALSRERQIEGKGA